MLPRSRSTSSPATAELHLRVDPHGSGADWHPVTPAAGWALGSAVAAAVDYGQGDRLPRRRAYAAILRAVPGLHRADVAARLGGRDALVEAEAV